MDWDTDLDNFDLIFVLSERAFGILHGVGGSYYLLLYLLCEYKILLLSYFLLCVN